MERMKQTAVEWLIERHFGSIENCSPNFRNHIEQAKEMEQVEKIKAQIDVLKLAHLRLSVEGIDKADGIMIFTINELERQLKELQ